MWTPWRVSSSVRGTLRVAIPVLLVGGLLLVRSERGPMPERVQAAPAADAADDLGPVALAVDGDGRRLFVTCANAPRLFVVDLATGKVSRRIDLPHPAGGLTWDGSGKRLLVTTAAPEGAVCAVDVDRGTVAAGVPVGHTPTALAVSRDGRRAYVANRFNNDLSVVDLAANREVRRVPVIREPVAVALTADGKRLIVLNHLPTGRADVATVAAEVTVLDTDTFRATAILLPNGSTALRGLCLSPDGRYAYLTHILAHYQLPTTQLERGWMCTNAVTVVDVTAAKRVNTFLLDNVDLGAANPWGIACSADGKTLCVALAGTHEVEVIDLPGLHDRLARAAGGEKVTDSTASAADVPNDLEFLSGLRRRVRLSGNGPRGLAIVGDRVYAAEHFSDSLAVVDLKAVGPARPQSIPLAADRPLSAARRGEMLFNNAEKCFQHWQSCASCHPDGRADGFNWDLLNDGVGNPKNTRNMLLAADTPPMMSLAAREGVAHAVRSGFQVIQFTTPADRDVTDVVAYLKAMKPVPSPALVRGELSPLAKKGRHVFTTAGCATCHPAPLYTNLHQYDLHTGTGPDRGKPIDTPTLIEVWRTAPYLHDGRAATLRDLFTTHKHGGAADLSATDLAALIEFVSSL
ncbi:MAG: hypothetical protein U0736_20240 [Gemmataceae bacterium]